ncbi:MAG: fibronectin type III domain-containing protein [Actinomycetales bacterium]|nr:fibronectin type III domain-containing protein [Actinomycetales bacterium]
MDTWIGAGKANTASMLATCTSGAANLAVAYTSPVFDTSPPASTTEPGPGAQAGTPGAPTAVRVVASRGSVTVSWKAPTGDGGSPITGYVVVADPGGRSCSTIRLTCKVTGLRAGRFRILVTARNAQGLGEMAPPAPIRVTATGTQLRSTAGSASQKPRALAGGKSDWFLPSAGELLTIGVFIQHGDYWSSSQYAAASAWQNTFGILMPTYNPVPKTYLLSVRPIRAF